MNLLMIDTETTGTNPERNGLLTLAAVAVERNAGGTLKTIEEREWLIKLEPNFVVTAEALAVNKLDLDEHNSNAIPESEVLRDFVRFSSRYMNGKQFPTLLGWNIHFDEGFLKAAFERQGIRWPFYFVNFDVAALWKLQKLFGDGEPAFGGIKDAARVLLRKSVAHGALDDAKLQLEILNFYLERIQF